VELIIKINLDGEAFEGAYGPLEVEHRIKNTLHKIRGRVGSFGEILQCSPVKILDSYGNECGTWRVK
jgi:hypothetical protein